MSNSEFSCVQCFQPCSLCYQGCQVSCYHFKNGCLACLECFQPCFQGFKYFAKTMFQCLKSLVGNTCCVCCTYCECSPWIGNLCNCEYRVSNPFMIPDKNNNIFALLINEFDSKGMFNQQQYGQCELLEHNITKELIIMKKLDISDKSELKTDLYSKKLELKFIHLFQLRFFHQKQIDTFCHQIYRQYFFYDYILNDLHSEWLARKEKRLLFLQSELYGFLLAALSALLFLQNSGAPLHQVPLNLPQIFISQQGYFKISLTDESCMNVTKREIVQYHKLSNKIKIWQERPKFSFYLAPEQIEELQGIREEQKDSQNSCLFQVGMLTLQLGLMEELDDCYNYPLLLPGHPDSSLPEAINIQLIQTKALALRHNYEQELSNFVDKLMVVSYIDRFSLVQAYQEFLNLSGTQNLMSAMGPEFQVIYTSLLSQKRFQIERQQQSEINLISKQPQNLQSARLQQQPQVDPLASQYAARSQKYELQEILKRKNYQVSDKSKLAVDNAFSEILRNNNYKIGFKRKPIKDRLQFQVGIQSKNSSFQQNYNDLLSQQFLRQQHEKQLKEQEEELQKQYMSNFQKSDYQQIEIKKQDEFEFVKEIYPNGCTYEGYKCQNMREGHGQYGHPNGSYYLGDWRQNKMHGNGKFFNEKGAVIYDGTWKDDEFDGFGTQYNDLQEADQVDQQLDYQDINKLEFLWTQYKGQFKNDMKQGNGTLTFANGDQFEGEFDEDQINGLGKITIFKTKQVLKGKWINGILQ